MAGEAGPRCRRCGRPGRASLTRLKLDGVLADLGADPLYKLELVPGHRRRHRDVLDAMGAFHDLRQLTIFEVAR